MPRPPAGYKLKDSTHTEIDLCPKGQVSFYDTATAKRVPFDSDQACIACAAIDASLGLVGAN